MNSEDCARLTYGEITLGQEASFSVAITDAMMDDFGRASGNLSPLHMDEEYSRKTPFGHRIVHGMMIGSLFSRLFGMYLPGEYGLCLSETLQFHLPIFAGDTVIIRGVVTHKTDANHAIVLRTTAESEDGKRIFVSGDALIKVLK